MLRISNAFQIPTGRIIQLRRIYYLYLYNMKWQKIVDDKKNVICLLIVKNDK